MADGITGDTQMQRLLDALTERAKELNCLYQIEDLLNDSDSDVETVLQGVIEVIPPGWQYPDVCVARMQYGGLTVQSEEWKKTPWVQTADIRVHQQTVGRIEVYYTKEMPPADEGPFLKEERRLIHTIADRIGHFILHKNLRSTLNKMELARKGTIQRRVGGEWPVVVDLLKRTDTELFYRIARKMMNHLCWHGVKEAEDILQQVGPDRRLEGKGMPASGNRPSDRNGNGISTLSNRIFEVADNHMADEEILQRIQRWIQEDKSSFLIRTLIRLDSHLGEIADAVRRFHALSPDGMELAESTRKGVKVALVRRFLNEDLEYIRIAKDYVELEDFVDLIPRMIHPPQSHGKLGGKGGGLFLAARILKHAARGEECLEGVKVPKTWYLTSDGLHAFMSYNNLEEVTEQKYKDIGQVRQEYPHLVQLFKSSHFPPEIVQGLSMALDDFGDSPIIVRSSSLLEDRLGSAFSGKYMSLFLANQGTKNERLNALVDAVAEVYASTFSPDPIEYRTERGLVDFHEEMGILIQQVVGTKVGKYYLPTFAGVAFSRNEFRWGPRIQRTDGLLRLVPGLGTRAVDRLSDDYPVLVAPGKPELRVNVTMQEKIRYSPNTIDVINLETTEFESISIQDLLRGNGDDIPGVEQMVSVMKDSQLRTSSRFNLDFERDDLVVTFESLISSTDFVKRIKLMMDALEKALGAPVDIEFASDGKDFYLLQCRPQSFGPEDAPAPIPKDIPEKAVVFSANRHVSNGFVPDVTHVVYVDPERYSELNTRQEMLDIARAIGKLNKMLPKRGFILMGPGRWGSRGDIKLGVPVTYSDINNTSMLIEIARAKGRYVPDLSFGTHFFQDLVEAQIRYLPLYPDDPGILFNEHFLRNSHTVLKDMLPDYDHLEGVLRVIDVRESTHGKILKVFMNADLDEAVGILTQPSGDQQQVPEQEAFTPAERPSDEHWNWRLRMAEMIARRVEAERFGVKGVYLFGSTKNATAGPGSDIDLLFHVDQTEQQKHELMLWLEGWSKALAEVNYLRTGYRSDGILDAHLVTDEDIEKRTSYAVKIGAVTDAARPLPMT
ncbi:pyruvate, phosphate dikinase [bacterium]|nr:pyruvate, phosphate dikinase [bacterium]